MHYDYYRLIDYDNEESPISIPQFLMLKHLLFWTLFSHQVHACQETLKRRTHIGRMFAFSVNSLVILPILRGSEPSEC